MKYLNRFIGVLGVAALFGVMLPSTALAVGTAAGTDIPNTATATYEVGGVPGLTKDSNTVIVTVQQVTGVVVVQTNSPVGVTPGATNAAASFRITNTGNGADTFDLTPNSTIGGDDFDPTLLVGNNIAIDTNGNGVYDVGVDTYTTTVALNADAYTTVFILNDIPGGVVDADSGLTEVTAVSQVATGVPGAVNAGAGVGGVNGVVGAGGGTDSDQGNYVVANAVVNTVKTSSITFDPYGGASALPGSVIQYTLTITVAGASTADAVVITDAIPANTTYQAGTLILNGGALTDAADGDVGDFNVTNAGEVTISLGSLTSASAAQVITFDVMID